MNALRSFLYKFARLLGDISAVKRGKVAKRVERRVAGRVASRVLFRLFR